MKQILALALFLVCGAASATDYNVGTCGVGTQCAFSSAPINAASFADTETFTLSSALESTGTYAYVSSVDVEVHGSHSCVSSGRGGRPACYTVTISAASIDGQALMPVAGTVSAYELPINLQPGVHVMSVTGQVAGPATYLAHWYGSARGLVFTMIPNPPVDN